MPEQTAKIKRLAAGINQAVSPTTTGNQRKKLWNIIAKEKPKQPPPNAQRPRKLMISPAFLQ